VLVCVGEHRVNAKDSAETVRPICAWFILYLFYKLILKRVPHKHQFFIMNLNNRIDDLHYVDSATNIVALNRRSHIL
jgi:hypothetical protein